MRLDGALARRAERKEHMTLSDLIEAQKRDSFTDPSSATDEDALGILISQHFKWDGEAILRVAESALEDANFHTEAAAVAEMREALA
jgi:hypothetical protein